jgi:pSer/pThr/pTyr-binding forkhead associated (FHA) protein
MEYVLITLRVLMALGLLSFLAVLLWVLLQENRTPENQSTPPTLAKLVPQNSAHTFELSRTAWIGRDPNALIYIEDTLISARHAVLAWDADTQAWFVEDNASRNGTFVNGNRIVRHRLAHGDIVAVAGRAFRFELAGQAAQ